MNKEALHSLFKDYTELQEKILLSKGDDYSNTDRLSNFKNTANILNISPQLAALTLIATKVSRISNLLNSNTIPNNESLQDSILDLSNYSFLLYALNYDNSKQSALPES
jgi:hypothetical protein